MHGQSKLPTDVREQTWSNWWQRKPIVHALRTAQVIKTAGDVATTEEYLGAFLALQCRETRGTGQSSFWRVMTESIKMSSVENDTQQLVLLKDKETSKCRLANSLLKSKHASVEQLFHEFAVSGVAAN